MRFPTIRGVIRRRLLINYCADPDIVGKLIPPGMELDLVDGQAVVGICLIRLERLTPAWLPSWCPGLTSENAAHRIAIKCDGQKAVFIPRRDTSSRLNHLAGGRLFPGEHALATFDIRADGNTLTFAIRSMDGNLAIDASGHLVDQWPASSRFSDLETASAFFRDASLGYSSTRRQGNYDGVVLDLPNWSVQPFELDHLASSYFDDTERFPEGSLTFDHALFMENQDHRWRTAPSWQQTETTGHTYRS